MLATPGEIVARLARRGTAGNCAFPVGHPSGGVAVEVTLDDGLAAVLMGLAAQESARTGQAIDLRSGPYALA